MTDRPVVSRWRAALPSPAAAIAALTVVASLVSCLAAQAAGGTDPTPAGDSAPGPTATLWGYLADLFQLSTRNLRERGLRVAIILVIGLGAKLLMDLIQAFSRVMVRSEWGPLRYLFRNRQRSVTIHALLISVARYVVYFTAAGYILSQFGIDYRAYLASLSLIGIALGFGAQGLVQDVVTGFFILFEDQFSVGDMVEISGQVGVVEAIGLRTTRIRGYLGTEITLQNRNIPMAVKYPKGAVEVGVDVALTGEQSLETADVVIRRIAGEVADQFQEILVVAPEGVAPIRLQTGERFLRLRALIWPGQQWAVEEQLVPRLREQLAKEGIEIPGARVVTFYHFPAGRDEAPSLLGKLLGRERPSPTDGGPG